MAEKTLPDLITELNVAIKMNLADIVLAENEADIREALSELEMLEEHLSIWQKKINATKQYLQTSIEEDSFIDKINFFK